MTFEILNREAILFDIGGLLLRQTHPRIVEHFLNEEGEMQRRRAAINRREDATEWLSAKLAKAARK